MLSFVSEEFLWKIYLEKLKNFGGFFVGYDSDDVDDDDDDKRNSVKLAGHLSFLTLCLSIDSRLIVNIVNDSLIKTVDSPF